ncbi:hypothetical protein [Streptomyces sp. NPDC059928]|uniref:hypothetical protein n=1 Tax=unclassified Streptomyces TaxID=2593676 RepID=UPI003666109B
MPDQPDPLAPFRALLDQVTANAVQAARAELHTVAAVWTQAAHLLDQTIRQTDNPRTTPDNLVQIGWYCWHCRAINTQACRSDNMPIHVPAEWVPDMETEIARREEERDDDPAAFEAGEKGLTAPPVSLRRQIARALHRYDYEHDLSRNDIPSEHHFGEADAVLAVLGEYLDIGEAEAWCKTCRRVWDGKAHRCESDAEQALARVRALAADMRSWCSPHNIAVDYAQRIDDVLNGPREAGS